MNQGRTVFSQVMDVLPTHEFRLCVRRYQGNRHMWTFSCMDQFLCMAFAQLSYRNELNALQRSYGDDLDAHSHGESFLKLFEARFVPGGEKPSARGGPSCRKRFALTSFRKVPGLVR